MLRVYAGVRAAAGSRERQGQSESGRQVREFLNRRGLCSQRAHGKVCVEAMGDGRPPFLAVLLERDASDSLAAMQLVLAQPAISSQLIDNLNASMHLRALLTDVFLLGEVLRAPAGSDTSPAGS